MSESHWVTVKCVCVRACVYLWVFRTFPELLRAGKTDNRDTQCRLPQDSVGKSTCVFAVCYQTREET